MIRKTILAPLAAAGLALTLATALPAAAQPTPEGGYGPGYGYSPGWMMGPGYGPGWMMGGGYGAGPMMGPGYGRGYGPGWMMGPGYGHGWMMRGYGPCWSHGGYWQGGPGACGGYGPRGYGSGGYAPGAATAPSDLHLTVPQVTQRMQAWVKSTGNPNIALGPVVAKNKDTITADVVTRHKDALVQRYDINRHTGAVTPADESARTPAAGQ